MGNVGSCVGKSSSTGKSGSAPKTPHGIPLPPGKPRLRERMATSLHVEWDKPESDGGAQILAYIIKMCRAEGSAWKKLDADCERLDYVAKDLEPGESYKFFIQCENDNGVSKPSEISDVITTLTYDVTDITTVTTDVKETFGPSAEKYIKDEEEKKKDTQSSDSDDNSKNSSDEGGDKGEKSEKISNEFIQESMQESKEESYEETKSSEQTRVIHTTKSSERIMVTKTVQKSFTMTGGPEEGALQFETEPDEDIDQGTTLGTRIGAYTYSSDSLLEDGGSVTKTRDETREMTVHTSNITMTESTNNPLTDVNRDAVMDITVGNTISENSDDIPSSLVTTNNESTPTADVDDVQKIELTKTQVSETNTFSMTESKTFETRIPMKNVIGRKVNSSPEVSTVTEEQTSVKEVKTQSKLPQRKTSLTGGRKDSIPETEETWNPPKIMTYEVKKDKNKSERQIPVRRNSSGYSRSVGEGSPKTTGPHSENNNSPTTTKAITEISGIAVRRGSSGSNGSPQQGQTRIPGRGTPSGIPAPRVIVENRP